MALPIRPNDKGKTNPAQKVVRKVAAALPSILPALPAEETLPEGWTVDPKTGKKYRILPKTQLDGEGNPILQFPDFDIDNLNGEADTFLAHLRVPPSRNEIEELRRLRVEKIKKQRSDFEQQQSDLSLRLERDSNVRNS